MAHEAVDAKLLGENARRLNTVGKAIIINYAKVGLWPAYPGMYKPGSEQQIEQDKIIQEDAAWLSKHVGIIETLIQSGNRNDLDKASILANLTRVELLQALHIIVDGRSSYEINELRRYFEFLGETEGKQTIEIPKALGYADETVKRLANVLSLSPEETNIPIEVGIVTEAGEMSGKIEVRKDQISAAFLLSNLTEKPDTPIAELASRTQANERAALKERARESAKHHISVAPEYLEEQAKLYVSESPFFSDAVANVVNPQDPHRKAILAYHGLAASGTIDQAALAAINQDLGQYLEKALGRGKGTSVLRTQQMIEGGFYPVILYNTQKANYRISIAPVNGSYQLKIESVPSSDKHKNTQDRTTEGLSLVNQVLGQYFSYVETDVPTPGLVLLSPELEKMAHVDFEELSKDVLDYDLAHIGGLPEITNATIDNFVSGTIAYSEGKAKTKPNSILLVGETGSGKASVTKAVAREFYKAGIPIYRTASTEKPIPSNLIKALITFQQDPNGGVLVIEDLEHGWLEGPPQEVDNARASLLRILNEINQSPSHVIILNTEHPNKILGSKEALGQTHRVDIVPCKLEVTKEAIDDLTRTVVAKLLTTDLDNPVTKDDVTVDTELKRLFGKTGVKKWESELLALAQEYADSAPLTGATLNGAFKAANWETSEFDVIFGHLKRLLEQKKINRALATEAQTSKELAIFQERLDAMHGQVEEQAEQTRLLFAAIGQLKQDTSGRFAGFEDRIALFEIAATELIKNQLASMSTTPGTQSSTPIGPVHRIGRRKLQ